MGHCPHFLATSQGWVQRPQRPWHWIDFCCIRPMTRSDLVEALAERFGQLTHRDAEFAVKALLEAMSDALARGHRIELRGFGSFTISHRPPRMGRNPRSGEQVAIPEKRVPHFKPGKALREEVDRGTPKLLEQPPP